MVFSWHHDRGSRFHDIMAFEMNKEVLVMGTSKVAMMAPGALLVHYQGRSGVLPAKEAWLVVAVSSCGTCGSDVPVEAG